MNFKAIQTFEMIIVTRVKLEGSDSTVCAVPSSYNRPSANYLEMLCHIPLSNIWIDCMLMDDPNKCVTETNDCKSNKFAFLQTYKDCLSGKVCSELSMRDRKYVTWVKSCVNMSRLHYFSINKIK